MARPESISRLYEAYYEALFGSEEEREAKRKIFLLILKEIAGTYGVSPEYLWEKLHEMGDFATWRRQEKLPPPPPRPRS